MLNHENAPDPAKLELSLPPLPSLAEEADLREELSRRFDLDKEGDWSAREKLDEIAAEAWDKVLTSGEKFGTARRIIFLMSDNPHKLPEHKKSFDLYGIETYQVPAIEHPAFKQALMGPQAAVPNVKVTAMLREESDIYRYGTTEVSAGNNHLERVENVSRLQAFKPKGDGFEVKTYTHRTEGYVDLSRQRENREGVFGWDDIFVVRHTGKSYQELREQGYKVSSRDMTLSDYLQDQIYYKPAINLKFNPQVQRRPIDFANSVSDFIAGNRFLNNENARDIGLSALFRHVADEGLFFRSPENRREKNYWLPGLNAGIPFVPKKDELHEVTFMAHDIGHFLIPDLVFTGKTSPETRQAYITTRMMSEAFTLVLADMMLIDTLKRQGVEYDFSKRKIFPLFQELGIDLSEKGKLAENLEKVLKANVDYCLRGDDSTYRKLIEDRGGNAAALESFKEKYMPFFVEDFRWTARNWENMTRYAPRFEKWWEASSGIRDAAGLQLETIEEFLESSSKLPGDAIDRAFRHIFDNRIKPALELQPAAADDSTRNAKAFSRYMLGQAGIFAEFGFVPEAAEYRDKLQSAIVGSGGRMDMRTIDNLRGFYDQFVEILRDRNLISKDDAATYREVYPLYPPFFVYYDEGKSFYKDLAAVSKETLGPL